MVGGAQSIKCITLQELDRRPIDDPEPARYLEVNSLPSSGQLWISGTCLCEYQQPWQAFDGERDTRRIAWLGMHEISVHRRLPRRSARRRLA